MSSHSSSSSSEGPSLPPRHRPNMDSLARDTTEQDLWTIEDPTGGVESAADIQSVSEMGFDIDGEPQEMAGNPSFSIPLPRLLARPQLRPTDENFVPADAKEGVRMNVGKSRPAFHLPASSVEKPVNEFDELDDWNESEPVRVAEPLPEPGPVAPESEPVLEPLMRQKSLPVSLGAVSWSTADKEGFSASGADKVNLNALRPKLGLSAVEKGGLIVLAILLLLGGGTIFLKAINALPARSAFEEQTEFPVKGAQVEILSAESYWRVPVTTGEKPDIVRRGTALIPVLVLHVRGGPSAIRVFFRDGDGNMMGDTVSRFVRSDSTIEFPATAGFGESWMHDSYRTGDGKPWTTEIFEAPSEGSSTSGFKRLLELNISAERH